MYDGIYTTHTHTHPFNGPLSRNTRVSRYQKGKPIWILLKQETVSGSGIIRAVCKSAPRSRQITTPAPNHCFLQARCPSCHPTNSVKVLKAFIPHMIVFLHYSKIGDMSIRTATHTVRLHKETEPWRGRWTCTSGIYHEDSNSSIN